jgi:hypothetical protein
VRFRIRRLLSEWESGISAILSASPSTSKFKCQSFLRVRAFAPVAKATMPSADFSQLLAPPLDDSSPNGKLRDLPGYCALTFALMPATSTSRLSVQVSDFEDICLLIQPCRLVCGFCSSGQRFACGFLQIPPRDRHPCRPANDSPYRIRMGLSPTSECALPGAHKKIRRNIYVPPDKNSMI